MMVELPEHLCESFHAEDCVEDGEIDLPDFGTLIEVGEAVSFAYSKPDSIKVFEHEFEGAQIWYPAPGAILILGDFIMTDRGIENVTPEED